MAGGYQNLPDDALEQLRRLIEEVLRRLAELERPTGSQYYDSLAQIKALVEGFVTAADITITGTLTAGGNLSIAGTSNLVGNIDSIATYNRLVTGSGSFRAVNVNVLGHVGQTVSSMRFKQDIETAQIPPETLRALRLVFFRYTAEVPFAQEQQPRLLGLIAEEVHDLGLTWLVVYDEEGQPQALVDFALPYLGLLLAQYNAAEIDDLRAEVDRLRA